jgi:uncharacterized protein YndB with AHSA1/START domain
MTTTPEAITRPHFAQFTIERTYKHSPDRVFNAFADSEALNRWFISGEGWEIGAFTHDFRVGGHDHSKFRREGHPDWFSNDTWYLEIAKSKRIVSAYTMSAEGKPFSHSLATIELAPDGKGGCRLTYTEQGAYSGSEEDIRNRKAGCEELYDKLGAELDTHR